MGTIGHSYNCVWNMEMEIREDKRTQLDTVLLFLMKYRNEIKRRQAHTFGSSTISVWNKEMEIGEDKRTHLEQFRISL